MILTENHRIKRNKHKELFKKMDTFCYCAKNLSNSVQYLICQCYRIHQKIRNEELAKPWEREMLDDINNAITAYNAGRDEKKKLKLIDAAYYDIFPLTSMCRVRRLCFLPWT